MAQFFDSIPENLQRFIAAQPMFFVATAAKDARINLSPKGMDTFRILTPNLVAYLDLTGSGNETAAHLKHDGRITVMFNSFDAKPLILRLYGKGRAEPLSSDAFQQHKQAFPDIPGARQVIFIDVDSVQTSCGYAVPFMELKGERDVLVKWAEKKGDNGLAAYQKENNTVSIDGLKVTD